MGNTLKALLLKGMCVSHTVPPPPWARMLPRSPAPSSVRSSRSSTGTRASSAWTGLATTTHPRPKGRGSAAAVSSRTPGLLSYETSRKARGGRMPQDLGPMKAFRVLALLQLQCTPNMGFLKNVRFHDDLKPSCFIDVLVVRFRTAELLSRFCFWHFLLLQKLKIVHCLSVKLASPTRTVGQNQNFKTGP